MSQSCFRAYPRDILTCILASASSVSELLALARTSQYIYAGFQLEQTSLMYSEVSPRSWTP
jgi:hypothetical protein